VIGGRTTFLWGNLDAHEVFDPITEKWEIRAPLPTPRGGLAAAVLKNKIYVFGGEQPSDTFKENEIYNVETNEWVKGPSLPTSRHGLAAVTLGDQINVISGGPTPGGSYSSKNEIFSID